jgi:hypothetical protein
MRDIQIIRLETGKAKRRKLLQAAKRERDQCLKEQMRVPEKERGC